MDNPAEFVAPCWNSGLGSPTPKLTRHSLLLCGYQGIQLPKIAILQCQSAAHCSASQTDSVTAGVCRVG